MISTRKNAIDKNEWQTPRELFDLCVKEFGEFDLDVAASYTNHLADSYYSKKISALSTNWRAKNAWLNPPFSTYLDKILGRVDIGYWLKYAAVQVRDKRVDQCVCLVPAQPSANWFYQAAQEAFEVRFLTPRVNYVHPEKTNKSGGNGGSAIILFKEGHYRFDLNGDIIEPPYISFWKWK